MHHNIKTFAFLLCAALTAGAALAYEDDYVEVTLGANGCVTRIDNGERIVYIAVMNNMTVDCDCVASPEPVKLKDYGILASLDPVALDQACVDIIFQMKPSEGNDNQPLIERINRQHGTHTIDHAEKIGLGSKSYELKNIDEA
jgi:uncharacterized Fe-S center protein